MSPDHYVAQMEASIHILRAERDDAWMRAETAEAAIQRVRAECDLWQRRHDSSIRHPTAIPAIAIEAVLLALDGAP